jgi:Spy/CpxP family protein refolding chaperone
MNFNKLLGAAVLAFGLTTAGLAQTPDNTATPQGRHGQRGAGGAWQRGGIFGRGLAQLNLTDAQKQTMRQLMQDARTQAKPYADQLKQNRQDLETAIKSNNTTAIPQLTERQAQLHGQVAAIRAKAMASFYAQLTPEQKAKADEMREQRKQRFENWQQRRQNAAPRNNG